MTARLEIRGSDEDKVKFRQRHFSDSVEVDLDLA